MCVTHLASVVVNIPNHFILIDFVRYTNRPEPDLWFPTKKFFFNTTGPTKRPGSHVLDFRCQLFEVIIPEGENSGF